MVSEHSKLLCRRLVEQSRSVRERDLWLGIESEMPAQILERHDIVRDHVSGNEEIPVSCRAFCCLFDHSVEIAEAPKRTIHERKDRTRCRAE